MSPLSVPTTAMRSEIAIMVVKLASRSGPNSAFLPGSPLGAGLGGREPALASCRNLLLVGEEGGGSSTRQVLICLESR